MSDTLQAATTGPTRLELTDGNEYEFAPISLTMWDEFCRWWNVENGRKPTKPVGLDDMLEGAMTLQGLAWLCWRSVKEAHDVKRPEILTLMGSIEVMQKVFECITDLPDPEPGDNGSDPPR